MGTEADKSEGVIARLLRDEYQIRFDVTIPVILPVSGKRIVPAPRVYNPF